MELDKFLDEIKGISKRYDEIYRNTGAYFNIFNVLGISTKEVILCRLIAELINPKGCHYMESEFLRLFAQDVLEIELSEDEYKYASVIKEFVIDENRRIDIVIKTPLQSIPIEVKINAKDQDNQCYDYYWHFGGKYKVYYLTLFGNPPGEKNSLGSKGLILSNEKYGNKFVEINQISFKENILKWLEHCLEIPRINNIQSIQEVLLQFDKLVRKLTGMEVDKMSSEIVKKIIESKDNMETAMLLSSKLLFAKTQILDKVFKTIEERMKPLLSKYGLITENSSYYIYQEQINTYFDQRDSSYPGINYVCENTKLNDELELWFRIEVDYKLFAGFTVFNKVTEEEEVDLNSEVEELLRDKFPNMFNKKDGWWIDWEYLPDDSTAPDFKLNTSDTSNYNSIARLCDQNHFNEFMNKTMDAIELLLKKICI